MARDTRGESHDRHIRPNTGPPLTGGGSGINDNNTSRNQICCLGLVLLGNCVSNDTGGRVMLVGLLTQMDQTRI